MVIAANACARSAGIRRGHPVSTALALAPGLALRERDPDAETDALVEIATSALAFSPQVSIEPPASILVEISGSLRLFGGLPRLLNRLMHDAGSRGYRLRTGVAPTPTAASLLTRVASALPVVDPVGLPAALAPLSLALLDLDPRARAGLRAAGVMTLGAARRLPRGALARRFGPALVDTLDRAFGDQPDPRPAYGPPPRFERRLPLPSVVETVEALGFGVNRLARDLSGWLAARGLGVTRLALTLVHERHLRERKPPSTLVTFAFGAPAREPAHLDAVLRERLARVALPAPVDAIVLASEETAPLTGTSLGLFVASAAGIAPDAAAVPLVERLRSRLSDEAVIALETHAEHRPEQAMRTTSVGAVTASAFVPAAPRPLWLLDEARPLSHELERRPWVLRNGPERIESGWWDGRDLRRDYFVAESPRGEIAWIYRDHRYGSDDGEWFLHGLFA